MYSLVSKNSLQNSCHWASVKYLPNPFTSSPPSCMAGTRLSEKCNENLTLTLFAQFLASRPLTNFFSQIILFKNFRQRFNFNYPLIRRSMFVINFTYNTIYGSSLSQSVCSGIYFPNDFMLLYFLANLRKV